MKPVNHRSLAMLCSVVLLLVSASVLAQSEVYLCDDEIEGDVTRVGFEGCDLALAITQKVTKQDRCVVTITQNLNAHSVHYDFLAFESGRLPETTLYLIGRSLDGSICPVAAITLAAGGRVKATTMEAVSGAEDNPAVHTTRIVDIREIVLVRNVASNQQGCMPAPAVTYSCEVPSSQ